jgi:hypothetical protein
MLKTIKWLNIEQRLTFNLCCQMWKIVNRQAPSYLDHISEECQQVHSHNTRASSRGDLHHTSCHRHSLKANGTKAWNALPMDVRKITNFKTFKLKLAEHLKMDF